VIAVVHAFVMRGHLTGKVQEKHVVVCFYSCSLGAQGLSITPLPLQTDLQLAIPFRRASILTITQIF